LDHAKRLLMIDEGLTEWFDAYPPDAVAVERVFAQHNLESVTGTAQAAGIAMLLAAKRGIPAVMHTPTEVKAAITGSGSANKEQVGNMVARVLNLKAAPKPADAADAVALAICHLWRGGAVNRYAAAVADAKKSPSWRRSARTDGNKQKELT
jgi:crossover junction endodeoxyribonuclease RuvC